MVIFYFTMIQWDLWFIEIFQLGFFTKSQSNLIRLMIFFRIVYHNKKDLIIIYISYSKEKVFIIDISDGKSHELNLLHENNTLISH